MYPRTVSIASSPTIAPAALPGGHIPGLYVHIPFCFHKCHYCDFYSITHQQPRRMRDFVDRLLLELDLWLDKPRPTPQPATIFFGGGTPSLLPVDAMERLLAGIRRRVDLSQLQEWTVEVNPATADLDYCHMLRASGVDRLSFGAQSFDTDELKILERHHNPDDVHRSIDIARTAGFTRYNLDLIFAIPGQSMQSWERSLDRAIGLGSSHLSCYALTYEPNTPLAVRRRIGRVQGIDERTELRMLAHTRLRLNQAGMPAYEISNFARPGQQCAHNVNYWQGGSYIGIGPSAASHVHGWRFKNRGHLGEWEKAVDNRALPTVEVEHLDTATRVGEYAMLRLRLQDGIDTAEFLRQWGISAHDIFADPIDRYVRTGLLECSDGAIRLSEAGVAVADAVAGEFLSTATAHFSRVKSASASR